MLTIPDYILEPHPRGLRPACYKRKAVFLLFLLRKSRGEVSGKNSFSGFHPSAQRNAFRLDAASTIQIVRLYESTVAVLFTGEPNGDAVANSSIDTIASCFPLTL